MLDEKITKLAEIRERFRKLKEACDLKLEELKATQPFKDLEGLTLNIAELDSSIRTEALDIYDKEGEKNPHKAVSIKIITGLGFDTLKAIEYAKREMPHALILDTRVFTKIIKALPEENVPDCVTITKTPRAEIARDLSAYLVKDEVTSE